MAVVEKLAVVPWQLADREVRAGRLARLALRDRLPPRQISLYRRADVPLTPIAGQCAEIVRAEAKRQRRAPWR